MKITRQTLLEDLYRANIIDRDTYLHINGEGYRYANDILLQSIDQVSWS